MPKDFKQFAKTLPQLPGVYIYKDESGEVIYVGKAKNLKSRVGSYFFTALDKLSKTYALVQKINDIDYIIVDNEFDALILEATLIKKYQPKYNIVLKDDKSFLYIVIQKSFYPKVVVSRKTNLNPKDKNFGPFTNSTVTKQVLRILRRLFPHRDCSESKFNKYRKLGAPCLYGHINLCPGPCVNSDEASNKLYKSNIREIERILSGGSSKIIKGFEQRMKSLAKSKDYEQAAKYRDLVTKFSYVRANYRGASEYLENPYLIDDRSRQALQSLVSVVPILRQSPARIECYDISNISGKESVGSMVVATDGKIDKSEYRRFKIRFKDTPDDVDMIYDVISRRFNRDWERPGLLVVDGGKPQVSAAERALEDMQVACPVVRLAKKFETIVFKENGLFREVSVDKGNPGLKLLIVLRDEAHRFAQSYHHLLRLKSLGV